MRDAAARKQRDALGAQEPRGALGRVARVCVLGEEDQQPAPELLVQRREDERKRRLRDARAARAAAFVNAWKRSLAASSAMNA